ncbi:MAG: J domain-containing protein [Myxococcota bacterium]
MSQARSRNAPDEGLLDKTNVAQLLAEAWAARRSGRLRIARGKSELWIELVDGAPVSVDSNATSDPVARLLEGSGQLGAGDRRKLEQFARERECSQASAALALKLVDPTTLYQAIRTAAKQQIAETFEWQAGAYQWSAGNAAPANAKPHDILTLIQTELPRRWGSERLFAALLPISEASADISPRLRRVALKLGDAGPTAAAVLQRLDGTRPLGRILGESAGDVLAASTLWTLWHAGVLRVDPARPARPGGLAGGAELEFEVEIATDRAGAATPGVAGPAAADVRSSAPLDPETSALRDDIEGLAGALGKLDHYAVLGLDASADGATIKKAYFKAAKRYHPDSLARKGLADLEEKAARVFGRVSEAFETLTDPDKKAAYDRGASNEPEIDTARPRPGRDLLSQGRDPAQDGQLPGRPRVPAARRRSLARRARLPLRPRLGALQAAAARCRAGTRTPRVGPSTGARRCDHDVPLRNGASLARRERDGGGPDRPRAKPRSLAGRLNARSVSNVARSGTASSAPPRRMPSA